MAAEGSAARLARNTLANGAGAVSGIVVGLVLTPLIITRLGVDEYGVFALALSLSFLGGYASLTDLGIEAATARFIAEARSRGDGAAENAAASTALTVFGAIALVATPLLLAASGALVELFGISGELRGPAQLCFAFVAIQLLFELPARAFFAVLEGAQRFTLWQAIELTRTLTQAVGFVGVLFSGLGVAALGAVMAATSLVSLVLAFMLSHHAVPTLRMRPTRATRETLSSLLSYGSGLMLIRLTGTLYRQMDKLIVATALGVAAVAVYEVANRIHSGAATVQSVAASALVPTTAFLRENREALRRLYLEGTALATAACLPFAVGIAILAEPLIRSWVGSELLAATAPTRLFMSYLSVVSVLTVGATMIVALGQIRPVIALSVGNLAINAAVSLALVGSQGINGVVIGTVAGQLVTFPFMQALLLRRLSVSVGAWLRGAIAPNLPGLLIQLVVTFPLLLLAERSSSVLVVGMLLLISVASSYAGFIAFGMDRSARRRLLTTLRSGLRDPKGRTPAEEEQEFAPGPEAAPVSAGALESAVTTRAGD